MWSWIPIASLSPSPYQYTRSWHATVDQLVGLVDDLANEPKRRVQAALCGNFRADSPAL